MNWMGALHMLLLAVALAAAENPTHSRLQPHVLMTIEPAPDRPRNSEGDIVRLDNGRLCLVYTRFVGGSGDHSSADLVLRTSDDEGRTWTDDRLVVRNEADRNVMSVSIVPVSGDKLLLFYLVKNTCTDCRMYLRRTDDGLQTLSEPILVTGERGYHVVNNDRVVRLSSGRLVVPAALHPCPTGEWGSLEMSSLPRVYHSDDEGVTWHRDETFTDTPPRAEVRLQEPGVVELKDGRLWMWFRTNMGVQYECFSEDGGVHWSEPRPGPLASPISPASIKRIPWTGDLLCVWNDHSGWHTYPPDRRTPLCVAISRDDGSTWSPSRVIEGKADGWYCYTSITFTNRDAILSYCAGDRQVGGLNRLKVLALPREWLCMQPENAKGVSSR